jgi:hypothetical protein
LPRKLPFPGTFAHGLLSYAKSRLCSLPQSIVKYPKQEVPFRGIGDTLQVLGAHLKAFLELSGISKLARDKQRRTFGLPR